MLLKVICVIFLSICGVLCYPSDVLKVGSEQRASENHKGDNLDVNFKSKTSNFDSEKEFNNGAVDNYSQEEDIGKYSSLNDDKNHHLDRSNYVDQNYDNREGGSVSDFNKNSARKKGHHKSGFNNSYHKDESSSKSSYYDDNDEQDGDYIQNSQKGSYGNINSRGDEGAHLDDSFRSKQNRERAEYENGRNFQKQIGNYNDYNGDNYYRNDENVGKIRGGIEDKSSRNYYEDKYRTDHHPHYPQGNPHHHQHRILYNSYDHPEKSTITIYEDPRIYQQNFDELGRPDYYNEERIRLNILPPLRRNDYYNHKQIYEYDY